MERFGLICFSLFFFIPATHQSQTSQTQVLLQLRKHLGYPKTLDAWNQSNDDLCYTPSSPTLSIVCEGNSVTQLRIVGDKPVKVSNFKGFPLPGQTLSERFSLDSFVTTLTRLSSLRLVCLVSLGLWGPFPEKIHRLYSLEVLDLSSNFLYGSIPPKISAMTKLQTLTLDSNFFNGTVPDWFDSMPNLTFLSLKSNQLTGPFPESVGRIKNLTDLALSQNHVSGGIPDLSGLSNLEVLDLRENKLSTGLTNMPKSLVTILLSRNSLADEIPKEFGELLRLQHLDLSFNLLHGTPPSSLFSLPNISYLNLEFNQLSGSLPKGLHCSHSLGYVDISTNRLTGALPSCLSSRWDKRVVKFGGNCLSADRGHQNEESFCKEASEGIRESRHKGIGALVGVIGGVVVVMFLAALAFLLFCRRYCSRGVAEQHLLPKALQANTPTGLSSELLANARYISQVKLGTRGSPVYRLFSLEELNEVTNNFDQSSYLGNGSTGKLYKGRLENGAYVAIRCLALFKRYSIRNLQLRLDLLSKLCHPHLVGLLGHCIDGSYNDTSINRVFLVYEYVPNGNLRSHLCENSPDKVLKWSERLSILIGVAKAVHFLHTGIIPGFFNNRLKANNILLDEHYVAKLSDYGLSIITEEIDKLEAKAEGHKSSLIENQTLTWQLKKLQDDVYSFGLILLETLVGGTVSEKEESYLLNEMASSFSSQDGRKRMVDPIVLTTACEESLSIIISIAKKCISPESSVRPSIEDVIWNLHYAAQVQATADGDQKSELAPEP
ncbi:probable inactive leucine-rich repeat receptor-like protein kinase At3g03770 [Aristolochia californica]|uniref:probable inactive leucine-rich repeat receptor-like protein kinase At3g03770 n=1 Tax=Aristolochia californica TaxID=171875 RepID=UPI0035E127DA